MERSSHRSLLIYLLLAGALGSSMAPDSLRAHNSKDRSFSQEPEEERIQYLEKVLPAACRRFTATERAQLRRAKWLKYDLKYNTAGTIIFLRLASVRGVQPSAATDQHLQRIIRYYVRMHVPSYLKTPHTAHLRKGGIYLPGHKLPCL